MKFKDMQIDRNPFPANTFLVDLQSAKVLIQPDQAESAKGKNVIIGDERPMASNAKVPTREIILDKSPDGKETIKVTIKGSGLGGASQRRQPGTGFCDAKTGQAGFANQPGRFHLPTG